LLYEDYLKSLNKYFNVKGLEVVLYLIYYILNTWYIPLTILLLLLLLLLFISE